MTDTTTERLIAARLETAAILRGIYADAVRTGAPSERFRRDAEYHEHQADILRLGRQQERRAG